MSDSQQAQLVQILVIIFLAARLAKTIWDTANDFFKKRKLDKIAPVQSAPAVKAPDTETTRNRDDLDGDILLRAIDTYRDKIAEMEKLSIKKDVVILQLQTEIGKSQDRVGELETEIARLLRERR